MGLSKPALRFLARTACRKPMQGSWLTLGRQCVYATLVQFTQVCREEGVLPRELPADCSPRTNIPSWRNSPLAGNASDQAVLRALGAEEVLALDYADFEGAELVYDLNQPVPQSWWDRFDGILDSGTLEHVFAVPTALANLARMLRVGGRVIHISPCNNFANHGFYQFSPTLLADFYEANAFADLQVFVAEETGTDYQSSFWDLFEIDPRRQPVLMTSRRRLLLIVLAEKTAVSTADRPPLQTYYRQLFDSSAAPEKPPPATPRERVLYALKRWLPVSVKTWLRRSLFGRPDRKPWGAKRLGRLK
jgi:SAM-dependent methyltransferase